MDAAKKYVYLEISVYKFVNVDYYYYFCTTNNK